MAKKLENMKKAELVAYIKELQTKEKKEEKEMKIMYINTKSTKEGLHNSLMALVYGCKPTKKVPRQIMDQDIEQMVQYMKAQGYHIVKRNFHDVPSAKRPKGFSTKFATYIYKK